MNGRLLKQDLCGECYNYEENGFIDGFFIGYIGVFFGRLSVVCFVGYLIVIEVVVDDWEDDDEKEIDNYGDREVQEVILDLQEIKLYNNVYILLIND